MKLPIPWLVGFERGIRFRRRAIAGHAPLLVALQPAAVACALLMGGAAVWWLWPVAEPAVSLPYSDLHATLIREIRATPGLDGRLSGFPDRSAGTPGDAARGPEALGFAATGAILRTRELLQVDAEVERRLAADATAEDLATAGALEVLKGRAAEAVALLDRAVEIAPADSRMLSDLALARAELARERGAPHLLVDALEAALQAVKAEPGSAEANFNAGAILEDLALSNEARKAWEDYLQLDRSSRWADRARSSLSELWERVHGEEPSISITKHRRVVGSERGLERLVRQNPYRARRIVEEEVLPRWAKAYERRDHGDAGQWIALGRRLGRVLAEVQGDTLIADSIGIIDEAVQMANHARLSHLSRGHALYSEGLDTVLYDGCASTGSPLSEARRSFRVARSPFAGWAALQLAICEYYNRDYIAAWRHLDEASKQAAVAGYPNLAGRTLWISGLVAMVEGDLARSIHLYQGAVDQFSRSRELGHSAYIESLIAKDLRILGAPEEAWIHRMRALRHLDLVPGSDRRYTILQEAAEAVEASDHPAATRLFLNELVAVSDAGTDAENPDLGLLAHLQRAETAAWNGEESRARRDLRRIESDLGGIREDLQLGHLLSLRHRLVRSLLFQRTDPKRVVELLDEAIRFHQNAKSTGPGAAVELVKVYRRRAKALTRLDRREEAAADLRIAIEEGQRQHAMIFAPVMRAEYRRELAAVQADLMTLELDAGRPDLALEVLDRSRASLVSDLAARDVGDAFAAASAEISILEGRERLPADLAVLEFAVSEDRLIRWVVKRDSIDMSEVLISRSDIRAMVDELRVSIEGRADLGEIQRVSARLHRLLIPRDIHAGGNLLDLAIVPAPELADVPFGALYDPRARSFLIEDFSVVVAPAISTLLEDLGERTSGQEPSRVLVVANPAFDRARYPRLPELSSQQSLGTALQASFDVVQVLEGSAATETRFTGLLAHGGFDIVHFGGHAVTDPLRGELVGLLLAAPSEPEDSSDGFVEPRDLALLGETEIELVVLDGCRSGLGVWSGGQAIAGLTAGFRALGAPTVVATLWSVDDTGGRGMIEKFYSGVADGRPAHHALREAAISAIRSNDSDTANPFNWAGHQVLGLP